MSERIELACGHFGTVHHERGERLIACPVIESNRVCGVRSIVTAERVESVLFTVKRSLV